MLQRGPIFDVFLPLDDPLKTYKYAASSQVGQRL